MKLPTPVFLFGQRFDMPGQQAFAAAELQGFQTLIMGFAASGGFFIDQEGHDVFEIF